MFKSIIINIHKFIHIIGIPCILQIKLFKVNYIDYCKINIDFI